MRRLNHVVIHHKRPGKEVLNMLNMAKEIVIEHDTRKHRTNPQNIKRDQHDIGAFVGMIISVVIRPRLAMESEMHKTP